MKEPVAVEERDVLKLRIRGSDAVVLNIRRRGVLRVLRCACRGGRDVGGRAYALTAICFPTFGGPSEIATVEVGHPPQLSLEHFQYHLPKNLPYERAPWIPFVVYSLVLIAAVQAKLRSNWRHGLLQG